MLKGFKDFLMRGNVIDLATAVVVGAAFTAIVTAFTTNIIEPLINSIGGTDQAAGLGFTIRSGNPETFVNIGALITAIINFLIIAAIVYFVIVMPYEKLKALAAKDGDDATALSESELLTEIRDILQGKDPIEEKAKIAAAKSEKDQAEIDRRQNEGPPSGPLYSGPISGGAVGASAAGTQQFSAQPSGPIGGANPYPHQGQSAGGSGPIGQPSHNPPPQGGAPQGQSPLGGPPPGYQQPSGPPPGYNPAPPQRPNPPQYGAPDQGSGYRPDPLTGPLPGHDPLTGPPPNYGPPPGRPDDSNGGGRHSSP
ncbi:large conductance mechanosensitive channel [Williamsia limnetica]|uniref:Large-conductance mechanosensitive channel n=1 Tax=Williamsia limnetica TaxID=882452 RepID=A0A318RLT0_WILLI|nr:large-conductance mechanosensitive channel protein MscL [Williamsia limnetica]PYE19272.1 large conductance mechanosensitive channel [Williamsia limnetica]